MQFLTNAFCFGKFDILEQTSSKLLSTCVIYICFIYLYHVIMLFVIVTKCNIYFASLSTWSCEQIRTAMCTLNIKSYSLHSTHIFGLAFYSILDGVDNAFSLLYCILQQQNLHEICTLYTFAFICNAALALINAIGQRLYSSSKKK